MIKLLFNSLTYLLFLPVAVLLFWALPHRYRSIFLLLASYFFYMSWLPVYGLLLFVLTVSNYVIGRSIAAGSKTKLYLFIGVAGNLATLSYYKYADFGIASWNQIVAFPFLHLQNSLTAPLQHILLPLGISFFVFEFIHYLADVYKGGKPIGNFVDFALFASFFPSQIAGPIKRYQDFVKQLEVPRIYSGAAIERGLQLILQGLFKKIAIADNLAPIVSAGFSNAVSLGTVEAWLAACAFAIQIYCDFSGYTDMGRGSAIMLGFDLPDNFNWPYIARNLPDFWRRWHISLSSWLRDYLYIPLGGSKCSLLRRHCNLLTTMLLGGLWHGASWHFVVWGAFHGLGLIACHSYDEVVKRRPSLQSFHANLIGKSASVILTFMFVLVGWIFFRADTVSQSLRILSAMISWHSSSCLTEAIAKYPVALPMAIYFAARILIDYRNRLQVQHSGPLGANLNLTLPARTFLYLCLFLCAIGLAPSGKTPFIYFQF